MNEEVAEYLDVYDLSEDSRWLVKKMLYANYSTFTKEQLYIESGLEGDQLTGCIKELMAVKIIAFEDTGRYFISDIRVISKSAN